jgi:uncharacterized protein YjiS (DUF1127 family)
MTQHILTLSSYLQSPIEGLIEAFRSFIKMREENAKIRATIKELNKLNDKELNDIGIARGDIWAVAHGDTSYKRNEVKENANLKGWV